MNLTARLGKLTRTNYGTHRGLVRHALAQTEYIAGTIPTNAMSVFKLLTLTNSRAAGTTIRWLSVSNKVYQVSSRTNLVLGAWQNLASTVTATGTNALQLDGAGTNGIRFYRVQVLP